ncbi:unnamed protein product, partial [Laminaria digitata]
QFGRYPEARNLYVRSLEVNPSLGNAHLNIGNIAFRAGRWEEGISRYDSAYSSPDADQRLRTVSSFMLGQARTHFLFLTTRDDISQGCSRIYRHGIGNVRKGVEFYKRSYSIDNDYSQALGCILQSLRSLCLWEGWEFLEPQMASAIVNEVAEGREPGPQSPYETRLTGELKPSQHLGLARLASKPYDRVARLPLLEDHDNKPPYRQNTDGGISGAGREDQSDDLLDAYGGMPRIGAGAGTGPEQPGKSEQWVRGGGRGGGEASPGLVVAYWSYDYRDHAMGHLTRGLFCSHQARQLNARLVFAVAASYGPNDGSSTRRSAEACAGKFLDVSWLGDVESAKAVAAEMPEIFVDLMAHTTGAR